MEHVFGWRPIHRTEADRDRLFLASAFGATASRLLFEEQRTSFFAECVKAPASDAGATLRSSVERL